jgi:hypothetical protein
MSIKINSHVYKQYTVGEMYAVYKDMICVAMYRYPCSKCKRENKYVKSMAVPYGDIGECMLNRNNKGR